MKKDFNSPQNYIIITVFFCIVACLIHLILFKINFFAISADESGRTLDAYQWSIDHTRLSDVWLPYSAVTTGLILQLWKDLFIVPRILCIFWGMCTLGAIGLYSFELFHDEKITILSLLLACFFPPLLVLAHVPLPEITFIFFVVLSMFFFLRWQKTEHSVLLIFSAFCLAVSSTIRYEGWAFVFVFNVQLVWMFIQHKERTELKRIVLLIAAIISLSFSIFWIIQTALTTESPISFIGKTSSVFSRVTHASFLRLLWLNVGTQFLVQCILTLNILGVASAVILWKNQPRIRHMLFIALSALICMTFMSFIARTLPTHSPWRIAVIWSCLFLPFTAHWLTTFFHRKRTKHNYFRYILVLLMLAGFCLQMARLIKQSSFSRNDYFVGKFLEHQIAVNVLHTDKILIETSSWNYLHVIIASQHPELFLYNSGFDPKNPCQDILSLLPQEHISSLEDRHIRLLVFQSTTYKTMIEKMRNAIKLNEHGDWVVYELLGERTRR